MPTYIGFRVRRYTPVVTIAVEGFHGTALVPARRNWPRAGVMKQAAQSRRMLPVMTRQGRGAGGPSPAR